MKLCIFSIIGWLMLLVGIAYATSRALGIFP